MPRCALGQELYAELRVSAETWNLLHARKEAGYTIMPEVEITVGYDEAFARASKAQKDWLTHANFCADCSKMAYR